MTNPFIPGLQAGTLLVAMVLLIPVAHAATHTVAPAGADFTTIQAAVDHALDGDTIVVQSGTYYEHVFISRRLTLRGMDTGGGKPIVDAMHRGIAMHLSAHGIWLEGFVIRNGWDDPAAGITGNGILLVAPFDKSPPGGNTITGNSIENNNIGIEFFHATGNTIKDNTITNNQDGISLHYADRNSVARNTIENSQNRGIFVTANSQENAIQYNGISHSGQFGIKIDGAAENNNIDRNTVVQSAEQGIGLYQVKNNAITNNVIDGVSRWSGIHLTHFCSENTIRNNTVTGAGNSIELFESSNNDLRDNTLRDNRGGIYLNASTENRLYDNEITEIREDSGIILEAGSNHNTVAANTLGTSSAPEISIRDSRENRFYLNNFYGSRQHVQSDGSTNTWASPDVLSYTYHAQQLSNYLGNYWGSYRAADGDDDGIGDTPYLFPGGADNRPLMEPWDGAYTGTGESPPELTQPSSPRPTSPPAGGDISGPIILTIGIALIPVSILFFIMRHKRQTSGIPSLPSGNRGGRPVSGDATNHHDVFISYSQQDKPIADAITAGLESQGVRCWIAPRDVTPGKNYPEEIIDAIDESRIMVLVFSSSSNNSPHIIRELTRAVGKEVIIIPFRIENVVPSKSMEYLINVPHWLDALTPPVEKYIDKLSETVHFLLKQLKENEIRHT